MRLGYSVTSFYGSDTGGTAAADRVCSRAALAVDRGYDFVEVGDHHAVGPGGYLQNVPLTGRLAAIVDSLATMALVPLYHPVFLAEQLGTLATLVDRFDLWAAVGGNPDSFAAFGVPMDERGPRLEEGLAILDRLWSEDEVHYEGEFHTLEGVSVNPKADPRICIGGGARPAVRRAGRLGNAWVAGPAESVEDIGRKREWVTDTGGGELIVRRDALVLPDERAARQAATEALVTGYRGWPADAEWPLVGSPGSIAQTIDRLVDVGMDELVIRPMVDEHGDETLRGVADAIGRT